MRLLETLVAAGLGAALAGVGAVLFGRRPRDVVEWNEAFLAGGGVAAALLFVFSLLFGSLALPLLFGLLGAVGFAGLVMTRPAPGRDAPTRGSGSARLAAWVRRSPLEAALVAWVGGAAVVFALANGRYHLLWDGLFIWSTKAMLLFDSGGLTQDLWAGGGLEGRVGRVVAYPSLVPLLQACVATARGAFDFDAVKPVFLLFYASLLAGTWGAGRALGGRRAAAVATALVAALPPLSTSWAAGGYADMPQAAAAVALAGALLGGRGPGPSWRQAAPWLFGAVVSVKSEGTILAVVALGGWCAAALLAGGLRGAFEAARRWTGGLLVIAGLLALRLAHARWTSAELYDGDLRPVNLETLLAARGRLVEVAMRTLSETADVARWGLLWPAFALGVVLLALRRDAAPRALAAAVVLAGTLYASIFLFTNWPVELHMRLALDRLLSQLAPAATLVIVSGLLPAERADAPGAAGRGT